MGLLDFIGRTGRGLGAAGRDVIGQMSGSTGPNDPSSFGGRFGNIIANEANPLGMVQTGRAFMDGFRGQSGTAPTRAGSVVGRGFIGSQPRPSQYGPRRSDALPRVNAIRDTDAISGGGFESETNPRVGSPGSADVVGEDSGPRPMRGGHGGYNGRSISLARGLGEGQRRTGDQTLQEAIDMEARMRSRGGLLAER